MREIFRDGDWRLVDDVWETAFIQHRCHHPFGDRLRWYFAYDGQCVSCLIDIPEPILGLRNLHRWDR